MHYSRQLDCCFFAQILKFYDFHFALIPIRVVTSLANAPPEIVDYPLLPAFPVSFFALFADKVPCIKARFNYACDTQQCVFPFLRTSSVKAQQLKRVR